MWGCTSTWMDNGMNILGVVKKVDCNYIEYYKLQLNANLDFFPINNKYTPFTSGLYYNHAEKAPLNIPEHCFNK